MTPDQQAIYEKMRGESVGRGIREFLDKNPTIRGVYWGKGGSTSLRRYLRPAEDKFLGLFLVDNRWDVMGKLGTYPGDVWQLAEEQSLVDEVRGQLKHVQEGTGLWEVEYRRMMEDVRRRKGL